jgi:UDP-N-acetylglucosamine 3-dehydrogenase
MKTEREKLEYALVTLRFANGAIANLQGFRGYEPETIVQEFAGTSGVIRYDSRRDHTLQIRTLHAGATGSSDLESLTPSYLNPYADMLQHFVQCILKREQPVVTEQDAYKAVEIAAAALESIDKGVSVRLGGKPHE